MNMYDVFGFEDEEFVCCNIPLPDLGPQFARSSFGVEEMTVDDEFPTNRTNYEQPEQKQIESII